MDFLFSLLPWMLIIAFYAVIAFGGLYLLARLWRRFTRR